LKAIYDSAWHHPFVAYLVGLWLLTRIVRQLPFLYAYTVAFLVAILADATATGGWSPVPLGTPEYTVFSVVFVILGDLRYFVLAERVSHPDRSIGRVLAWASGVSMIMPVTSGVLTRVVPAMQNDRVLYLVYEAAMVCIVLGLDRFRYAAADVPSDVRAWVHRVSLLFAGLYFGWAACDVIILLEIDAGHVARIVPNVLYYGAFLPFVFLSAPARMRDVRLTQEVA
jgi:hypothetical protein